MASIFKTPDVFPKSLKQLIMNLHNSTSYLSDVSLQRSYDRKVCSKSGRIRKKQRCSSLSSDDFATLASRLEKQKQNAESVLPSLKADHKQAVQTQLQVLQRNNDPYDDHGVEILYRYSNFDPFKRSRYFGSSLDLGQFERFRRMFHQPKYSILLCHRQADMLSSLQVSDVRWSQRVQIQGIRPNCRGVYTFTMVQRVGGCFDGIWFCDSLIADETSLDV